MGTVKKLLPVDLVIGALIGAGMFPWFGWWTILFSLACALLWALGGQYGHAIRTYGIPCVLGLPILWNSPFPHLWPILPCIPIGLLCSLGYGLSDPPDRPNPDDGSPFGRWAWNLTSTMDAPQTREAIATFLTRSVIVVGVWLSMAPWLILLINN